MLKNWIANLAYDFIKEELMSDKNIEAAREHAARMIDKWVDDPDTKWDDEFKDVAFKFLGFKRK